MSYEVGEPILNSPFEQPQRYWFLQDGQEPEMAGWQATRHRLSP